MSRFRLAAAALALCALAPAPAVAHQGDPNYLSQITAVTPRVAGLEVVVVNRDDRFQLINRTGETVIVKGYEDEPYARIASDGAVAVNTSSKAYYLNEQRDGRVPVPAGADGDARPRWKAVDRSGRFEWHDHRMHWMAEREPDQVTDPAVRTKIFDYSVPIEVGGRAGAIAGTLFWTPLPGGDLPLAAILAFAGALIALSVGVVVVRRRRTERPDGVTEAW